ncbi:MAG: hypothetical protein ACYC2H_13090 [Thermoplasmatota archaeon]
MAWNEWLGGQLSEPWLVPTLLAIFGATLGARATLRSNIRQKSWQHLYETKRTRVERLMETIQEFSAFANVAIMLKKLGEEEKDYLTRHSTITGALRYIFGPPPWPANDPLLAAVMTRLPKEGAQVKVTPAKVSELMEANQMLLNLLDQRMQVVSRQLNDQVVLIQLYLRNPRVVWRIKMLHDGLVRHAHQYLMTGEDEGLKAAGEAWSQEVDLLVHDLRMDLMRSARSFSAATHVNLGFRLRATRYALNLELEKSRKKPDEKGQIEDIQA